MARPEHKPTAATRRRVEIAAGGGMSHEAISQALKIDPKTLRKHYEGELASGANLRRVQILETLFASARKGNTSAAKAYLQNAPQFEALSETAAAAPPAAKQGKKEKAAADAVGAEAGTAWDGVLPANVVNLR
jgi:hypothetical protein